MSNLDLSQELKKLYTTDLSSNEVLEAEHNLFGFFKLLMEIENQNRTKAEQRKNKE